MKYKDEINDKIMSIRVPNEIFEAIKERAKSEDLPIAFYIRKILLNNLKNFQNN